MAEFQKVTNATRRVEDDVAFRFLESDKTEARVHGLDGEKFTIPISLNAIAYSPQQKRYLGMNRSGVSWLSDEEEGTIGKAPIKGALTFLDFFHGRFWCVGSDFQILSSQDGLKWESQLDREGVDAKHHPGIWTAVVGADNEEVYALGLDGIIGVFDGSEWSLDRVEGVSFWDAISVDGTIYACGSKGTIAFRNEEEWELINTQESDSFISFARLGNKVYISTESKLYEFQFRGISIHLNRVGSGGRLFVSQDSLYILDGEGILRRHGRMN